MVMPTKAMKPGEEDYAIACAVPVNSPGVRVINTTFHPTGDDIRHYPVSSQVSHARRVRRVRRRLRARTSGCSSTARRRTRPCSPTRSGCGSASAASRPWCARPTSSSGLAQLIAEANGLAGVPHIRDKIDEMVIHATLLRAGLEAALANAQATPEGYYYPDELFTNAAKYQGAAQFHRMVRHLHDIAGGAVLTSPSIADLENPETAADTWRSTWAPAPT